MFKVQEAWLAQFVEHETLCLGVLNSSPTLGMEITLKKNRILKKREREREREREVLLLFKMREEYVGVPMRMILHHVREEMELDEAQCRLWPLLEAWSVLSFTTEGRQDTRGIYLLKASIFSVK